MIHWFVIRKQQRCHIAASAPPQSMVHCSQAVEVMNAALLNLLAADLRGQKGVRAKRRCGEPFDPWCHPRLAGLGISWKAQMATVNWTESRDAQ